MGQIYFGDTSNKARKPTFAYFGVNGKAKKIKKAYMGVKGIAKLVFTKPAEMDRYSGYIRPLSTARHNMGATSINDYAIFAGGVTTLDSGYQNAVDAYDRSLTKFTPTALSEKMTELSAASIGSYYALFGCGYNANGNKDVVNAYSNSLTMYIPTVLSVSRSGAAATKVGNYILFGGGGSGRSPKDTVDAYSTTLTRSTPTGLNTARYSLAATYIGNYALFAGGKNSNYSSDPGTYGLNDVDVYNESLTKSTASNLGLEVEGLKATTIGNYALFAGGYGNKESKQNVTIYNTSLTRSYASDLSSPTNEPVATTAMGYGLFLVGNLSTRTSIDVYDSSLSKSYTALSVSRYDPEATYIGNYALFAGGYRSSKAYDTVEAYTYA